MPKLYPKDPDKISETIPALRVRQPIGDIYIASINYELIQVITYFDVRRVMAEERDVERYLGIQRPLNPKRVDDLKQYVNFEDATFPTSIIISIDSDYIEYNEKNNNLTISNTKIGESEPDTAIRNLCRVIDGQHRIAGLKDFSGKNLI